MKTCKFCGETALYLLSCDCPLHPSVQQEDDMSRKEKTTLHEVPLPDKYIVRLEPGVWLDTGDGDPPRTLREENAHKWTYRAEALAMLTKARRNRNFADAKIIPVPQSMTILRGDRLTPGHLAIITGDCPSLSMICVIIDHSEGMIKAKYLSTKQHKKTIVARTAMWTPLSHFGLQARVDGREVSLRDSGMIPTATYMLDGSPRKWQERNGDPDRIRGKRKLLRLAREQVEQDIPF